MIKKDIEKNVYDAIVGDANQIIKIKLKSPLKVCCISDVECRNCLLIKSLWEHVYYIPTEIKQTFLFACKRLQKTERRAALRSF